MRDTSTGEVWEFANEAEFEALETIDRLTSETFKAWDSGLREIKIEVFEEQIRVKKTKTRLDAESFRRVVAAALH